MSGQPNADPQPTASKAHRPSPAETPRPRNPSASHFLTIPQELRDNIYNYVFLTTRLTMGRLPVDPQIHIRIRPAPRSLSILRVCRQISREIGASWLGQVLFNFEDAATMLDKLHSCPAHILPLIRHLRVRDGGLVSEPHSRWTLAALLCLRGGLQLDRLTVLAARPYYYPFMDKAAQRVLDELVRVGQGWKELHFLCPAEGLLRWEEDHGNYGPRRREPLGAWRGLIRRRDGARSGSSVEVFKVAARGSLEAATQPAYLERYNPGDLVVVVRRGRDVEYAVPENVDDWSWVDLRPYMYPWKRGAEQHQGYDRYKERDEYKWRISARD